MYVPLERFLLRAPLLPVAALRRGGRALLAHPLGPRAIALGSPTLAAARPGERRARALGRYARRAAFRPTPHGLLAGVCLGGLGPRTEVDTGSPEAWTAPRWDHIDALARGLLDDPDIRERTSLRVAPSALWGAETVHWIGPGEPFAEARSAEIEGALEAILTAAERWAPWQEVRAQAQLSAGGEADEPDIDELLLLLIDDGLLQSDLAPPLVGPPPDAYLRQRLASLGRSEQLDPSGPHPLDDSEVHAVLIHRPAKPPRLARAPVERAARLVPLLVALQDALAPPAAERLAQPALADALDAVTEIFGAGAFDLGGLATGDYGVALTPDEAEAESEDDAQPDDDQGAVVGEEADDRRALDPKVDSGPTVRPPPHPPLVALLLNAIATAARERRTEAALDPELLAAALAGRQSASPPPTVELFFAPMSAPPGARAGTGWLLGLHAPAGSSFGRFAHALGIPMTEALADLAAAERAAGSHDEVVDLAFSPAPALADLAAHPGIRRRTLAISRWSSDDDLAPRDLELVADPAAPEALALRERATGTIVVPSPLARLRSATAPAGVERLLCGWSLQRQHAPWALPLGPFSALTFVPRFTVDGFVIAPASWRLPPARGAAALGRWRRALGVPRFVQVGEGDELLPVDLDASQASADLAGHGRAFEIWPPLDAIVDRAGRRLEAVVMLVDRPDHESAGLRAIAAERVRRVGDVPPPHRAPPAPGWRTFKLFGASAHQDELLSTLIAPVIRQALEDQVIDRWFFLRYVDGPGQRPHLRVRVHAAPGFAPFEERLAPAIARARGRALLTTLEVGDYFPERGRFPAPEIEVVHALFEADSELACAILADPQARDQLDRVTFAVCAADALGRGLGLDLADRHQLARERRNAADRSANIGRTARRATDAEFRVCARHLRDLLGGEARGPFAEHEERVARTGGALPPGAAARLVPTLLHLSAVRLFGSDRDAERLTLTFWERTLEGLRKRAP